MTSEFFTGYMYGKEKGKTVEMASILYDQWPSGCFYCTLFIVLQVQMYTYYKSPCQVLEGTIVYASQFVI